MIKTHIELKSIPTLTNKHALIVGTFDGVHRGHLALVQNALNRGFIPVVLIIYTHKKLIKPHQKDGFITTLEDRALLFASSGVTSVYYLNLELALLNLSPAAFVSDVLNKFNVGAVVVGDDFKFGKNALGNVKVLRELLAKQTKLIVVEKLVEEDAPISTSRIKEALTAGKLKTANSLLGRRYALTGFVVKGYGLGIKLGYPTANIMLDTQYFLPRHGVYLVSSMINNKHYYGMASLGYHPTVNKLNVPLLEVYYFDFAGSLYHTTLTINFHAFIRDELTFKSTDLLVHQISKDREVCLQLIEEEKANESN